MVSARRSGGPRPDGGLPVARACAGTRATLDRVRVLGVDACRAGWVGVELRDGGFAAAHLSTGLGSLIAGGWDAVGVDMPLGLTAAGWREADLAAARLLGARRSSVFRVPPRPVWAEADYPAANSRCRDLTGGGLSVQAWGLRAKVLEADALWAAGAALHEVHPEASFAAINGAPLSYAKTSWAGQSVRRRLLASVGIVIPDEPGEAGLAGPDDVLDAAAVAWTAHRIATGRATRLPEATQPCDRGRPIAIWT
jgi:predicted RNase H-like nuclease